MLLDGRAQETGIKRRGSDATLLLVYNAHYDVVNFTLPEVPEGRNWLFLMDTNQPDAQLPSFPFGHVYEVTGRSLLAFALSSQTTRGLRHGLGALLDIAEAPLPG
jgi:glycogen operon protein